MQLKTIYAPIDKELKQTRKILAGVLRSGDRGVAEIGRYVWRAPGKLLRPALVLLAAKCGKPDRRRAVNMAAAIELIHMATLTHDDVIDKAKLRRGQASVGAKFGAAKAVLFGDYLYSRAFEIISQLNSSRIALSLLHTATTICQGEMRQLGRAFHAPFEKKEYLKVISDKTASLFAAACESGGILADLGPQRIAVLKKYGYNLGVCFQIVDDCLDLIGQEKHAGKSLKIDKKNGKLTLPLMYWQRTHSKKAAIAQTIRVAQVYRDQALAAIKPIKNIRIKQAFRDLLNFTLSKVS